MFKVICAGLLANLIAWSAAPAAAAGFPDKPVRLIVPFAPGGGSDFIARALSDKFGQALGTTVIVENRPGASGTIGTALVAQSAPDGHTLLFTSASYTFNMNFYKNLPYDPVKDFTPVTNFALTPNVLVVHPSLPVTSVKGLLALARKRPGDILAGTAGFGSNIHLTLALFAHLARIKVTYVQYKGAGPGQIGVMSGEVQMLMPGISTAIPFIKSGRMRALAVTTAQRVPLAPDLPTIAEAGVPGYDKAGWFALFAPAAVPQPVIDRIYAAAARALKDPRIVKSLADDGSIAVGNTPAEFGTFVRAEIATWARLIQEMKLTNR